ncbi:MAG: hypothetical protein GEU88_04600 [Solirubrobacterales bacterium]|nr:hypothetical protein [Solirubrobacterales bacterium]
MSTYETESTSGEGWVLFAGVMIMIAGFLNLIYGIAAIDGSSFFTDEGRYVIFTDLNTWGWFILIIGVLQLGAAFSIWSRHMYGRMIGVATASISALVILFTVNAYPFAAFMLFIIDMLVIYGLVVHGGRPRTSV